MKENEVKSLLPVYLLNSKVYYLTLIDLEGKYLFVNDVFKKQFSFLTDSLIGTLVSQTIFVEDLEKYSLAVNECITYPEKTVTLQLRKSDSFAGTFYWTNWEFSLFKDKDGSAIGILCIGHDTTQTEVISRKAKEFAERIDTIVENITDGFYILNRNWEFIKINKATEQILGSTRQELLGKKIWDSFLGSFNYTYSAHLGSAIEAGTTVRFEEYRPDLGRWFSTVAYASPEGLTVFFRDSTKEHRTQQRLEQSENKLRAILDSTTSTNILISPDFKILGFNKTSAHDVLTFHKKEIAEGQDFWQYVIKGTEKEFESDFKKALAGESIKLEKEIYFESGFSIWFEISFTPVYDAEQKLIGVTFNTSNIDSRKRGEILIIEQNIKLERQNQKLRAIAWQQSHEVRRPVSTILGLINLINSENEREYNETYLNYLQKATEELDAVIHKIVNYTSENT